MSEQAAMMAGVSVRPVSYKVTIWPDDVHCMDQAIWCVTVRDDGFGNWSVRRGDLSASDPVLGRDWLWHHENKPSERTTQEISQYRFTHDNAMERAREVAARVEVQGMSAPEAVARHAAKGRCIGCEGPYTA
jgi:hypothetical protein